MTDLGSKVGDPIQSGSQRSLKVKTKNVKTSVKKMSQGCDTEPKARNQLDMERKKSKIRGRSQECPE